MMVSMTASMLQQGCVISLTRYKAHVIVAGGNLVLSETLTDSR